MLPKVYEVEAGNIGFKHGLTDQQQIYCRLERDLETNLSKYGRWPLAFTMFDAGDSAQLCILSPPPDQVV